MNLFVERYLALENFQVLYINQINIGLSWIKTGFSGLDVNFLLYLSRGFGVADFLVKRRKQAVEYIFLSRL
tara:strand:- start:8 stop:220 length:213 start_codon:yes stop_codon:yes gene_type:complete